MALTEPERFRLRSRLAAVVGEQVADDMMAAIPPMDWSELVTKDHLRYELAELRTELRGEMAGLRGEMAGLRGELRAELHAELSQFKGQLFIALVALVVSMIGVMLVGVRLAA